MTTQWRDLDGDPHDLLPGYLLDALDHDEEGRFTGHLPTCAACRAELVALSDTVADLATASHVQPPAAVEDRLIASLFGPSIPSRRRRWMWPAAAAAAFVLGAGVVATTGVLHGGTTEAQVAAEAEAQLILDVTSAPDAHFMPLDVPEGTAKLVVSDLMNMGAVMATDLPTPASGREYHVWTVMGDGSMESAATFRPGTDGHVSVMLHTGVTDAAAFMLTVEDPGAQHPTGEPLAEVTV
jgi:anti-sigma-K factor RskA